MKAKRKYAGRTYKKTEGFKSDSWHQCAIRLNDKTFDSLNRYARLNNVSVAVALRDCVTNYLTILPSVSHG